MTTGITKQKQVCPKCGRLCTQLVKKINDKYDKWIERYVCYACGEK